ncbi:MAG TPA: hypothetical protein PKY87_12640 [Terricaulis sp.]|nr:hypothetical protein [Terricaulis sp.]
MAQTKFSAGQIVTVVQSGAFSAMTGAYHVVSVMPIEGGAQKYRVKSAGEMFERVLDEVRLEAMRYD